MEEKLKNVIREEKDKVIKQLTEHDSKNSVLLTKWLQSLQRIENVCKNRNRY